MNETVENSKIRILIIDNDDPVREAIKLGLEMAHYEVAEANDGAVGLKIAFQGAFDLVITVNPGAIVVHGSDQII